MVGEASVEKYLKILEEKQWLQRSGEFVSIKIANSDLAQQQIREWEQQRLLGSSEGT
eukprot:m.288183 g.288183  ORF g.288183 m.288183 type:complete len:57 (-) comp170265_c0_seq1:82-252(-)